MILYSIYFELYFACIHIAPRIACTACQMRVSVMLTYAVARTLEVFIHSITFFTCARQSARNWSAAERVYKLQVSTMHSMVITALNSRNQWCSLETQLIMYE